VRPADAGLERASAGAIAIAKPVHGRENPKSSFALLGMTSVTIGQRGHFRGLTRGIASGDHDLHVGITANDAPDRLPRSLIGVRRNGTRVHHQEVRLIRRRFRCTARPAVDLQSPENRPDSRDTRTSQSRTSSQRLLPDVAARLHALEGDVRRRGIRDVNRCR
jgi:hypothetical protein